MINYYLITKPGILFGNLITFAAGFLLASKGSFDPFLFLASFLGLGFVMASGCVFNNYIDRHRDKKMKRTKNRALASGLISPQNALLFATALGLVGNLILFLYTNPLALFVADFGLFVYVLLYSIWKGRTIYGTAIGSVAGAVPPVVGYCAVSAQVDLGAFLFFSMMVLWQMPHFFAIALYRLEDYAAAKIPVLPIEKGIFRTKVHMLLYIIAFIVSALLLTYFQYTGQLFSLVALFAGFGWLILAVQGFSNSDHTKWGRQMFGVSLVVLLSLCSTLSFNWL